jgi:peptidase E
MKTKFVLHGGFDPKKSLENDVFFAEVLKDAPESAKVLIVLFAKEKDRWEEKYVHWKKQFQKNAGGKNLDFQMATLENFIEQLASADVVYFAGGRTESVLQSIKGFVGLNKYLAGKILVGDSAGANVFCEFGYSMSSDKVFEGLGLLPIKIIPHFIPEYANKFGDTGIDLEALYLKEYEYKVIWTE